MIKKSVSLLCVKTKSGAHKQLTFCFHVRKYFCSHLHSSRISMHLNLSSNAAEQLTISRYSLLLPDIHFNIQQWPFSISFYYQKTMKLCIIINSIFFSPKKVMNIRKIRKNNQRILEIFVFYSTSKAFLLLNWQAHNTDSGLSALSL